VIGESYFHINNNERVIKILSKPKLKRMRPFTKKVKAVKVEYISTTHKKNCGLISHIRLDYLLENYKRFYSPQPDWRV